MTSYQSANNKGNNKQHICTKVTGFIMYVWAHVRKEFIIQNVISSLMSMCKTFFFFFVMNVLIINSRLFIHNMQWPTNKLDLLVNKKITK